MMTGWNGLRHGARDSASRGSRRRLRALRERGPAFEVEVGGERVSPEAVFPNWSLLDRFGIIVAEPLGGLGASLLLQLAIAAGGF